MARFLVKASEFKNVCKAVNDRKLAELKKEIIEILKKQDENEVKKAIDYFNSQELHYTHLEKSLVSGKWIEKAGYGVGTVRIWKGKKYKKIAPGKWARVFDKEGRGTNIAIGKLISRVNKIDNAEDLLQFVMENKQRFIDEEGKELSIINKVRAAVDARNEKLSGESKPYVYGVGEEVSAAKNEMFSKKDKITKEEADLHKISRKYSQIPTSELKQRKAKLDRWIENKTRNKRDRLNNAIFRDSYKNEVEAINKELDKRKSEKIENKTVSKPAEKKEDENKTYWIQDFEGNRITSDDAKKKIKGIKDKLEYMESMKEGRTKDIVVSIDAKKRQLENYRDDLISKLNPEDRKEIESEAEKHQNRSDAMKGNKNAYKGGPKDVAKYINSQTNDDKERNSMLVEAFNERYGTEKDKDYAFYSMGELYNDVVQAKPHTDKWYDAMNKYNEAAEMYKMVIGDDEIDYYNREVEKIRMKPNWNKEKLSDSKIEKPLNNDIAAKTVSYNELKPIATNKSVGENEVQMPYSKDLADEIESLKNCAAPEWENREFMKHVYYDDGNLVTTDGRRLKLVKVGKLDGIQDGTYVDITTDKSGINIKKREGMEDYKFPTYKKVMPDNLSQNVTLDSKLVKEKIKAMQKDGAIDKKGANIVQLEFRDGKVFIDDTAVGDAKNIQLKTSEGWNDPKEDTNYVHFNADYLTNALSGKTAVLQMGEDNHKAMAINTGSTSNVLMPMHGLNAKMDYSSNRSVKAAENEAKDKKKADNRKHSEQLIKDLNEEKIKDSIENVAKDIDRQCETSDDDFLRSAYEKLNFNFDKILDKKRYITVHDKVNKDGLTFISAYMHSRLAKEHPEVKEKIAAELEKRGINVKKSLFDDFIMDVFAANDEEEIEDELYEGETEYNDYSAEQPELFNSTSMKVREALDRINNQVL